LSEKGTENGVTTCTLLDQSSSEEGSAKRDLKSYLKKSAWPWHLCLLLSKVGNLFYR